VRNVLKRLDADAERYLMLVFYCTVVFVIVNEVVRRFVFQYSSLWGEEVARYAFVYLGWVGAAQAVSPALTKAVSHRNRCVSRTAARP